MILTTEHNLSDRFDIRNFTERLTPANGKNRYVCPVCNGNNLTIDSNSGEYSCWNGCQCKDIREAISPWSEVMGNKSDRRRQSRKPKPPTPAPIPEGAIKLARFPEPVTHPQKRKRGVGIEIEYPYSSTQCVLRIEKPNPEKPKGYEKVAIPYHLDANGKSIKGKGDAAWNPYRIDEVETHGAGKWVMPVEGEPCVEAARFLTLVSFTLQGSAWTEDGLTRAMLLCKSANVAGIAYFPDNDQTGYEKATAMAAAAAKAQLPFIQLDPFTLWNNMPEKGDIADWVKWGMEENWDKEEFIESLERQFNAAAERARTHKGIDTTPAVTDPDELLKLELLAFAKETDPIRRVRRRQNLAMTYHIKGVEIEKIAKQLYGQTKAPQAQWMGLDELFDADIPGLDYLIPGMLPKGDTVLLIADPKVGKSLLAYDAAFAIATGESDFLGEKTQQRKVLIVQADEPQHSTKSRLLKRGFRREDAANVQYINQFNISQLFKLEEKLEEFRPSLVIIDSLRRINAGREISENSAEFADQIYELKELLTRYGTSGIIIHHANKNPDATGIQRSRGSSSIPGAVWGIWDFQRVPKTRVEGGKRKTYYDPKDLTRTLTVTSRDGEGMKLRLELDLENNHWISYGEEGVSSEELQQSKSQSLQVLELLQSVAPTGLEAQEINETLGLGRGIYSVLNRLLDRRLIGARQSATDKRKTVYYCPKSSSDGDVKKSNCHKDNPPSLLPCVSDVIEYAETFTEATLQSSITDRSQIDHRSITSSDENANVINSDIDNAVVSEIDHTPADNRGGEGVKEQLSHASVNGEAVGRLARIRNLRGELSNEAWQIVNWCDRNQLYTLENGETAYPFELFLTE